MNNIKNITNFPSVTRPDLVVRTARHTQPHTRTHAQLLIVWSYEVEGAIKMPIVAYIQQLITSNA